MLHHASTVEPNMPNFPRPATDPRRLVSPANLLRAIGPTSGPQGTERIRQTKAEPSTVHTATNRYSAG
jgi:hypothetical protein